MKNRMKEEESGRAVPPKRERTVDRKLERIRTKWERLEEPRA